MPTPFNRGRFGRKSPVAPRRECEACGGLMVRDNDEACICRECAGRPKQKPRLADKAEEIDRSDDDCETEAPEEFVDSYLEYYGRDAE